jgi:hypothetical protein
MTPQLVPSSLVRHKLMSDGLNLLAEAVEPKDQQQGNSCYCQYVNVHGALVCVARFAG